MLESIGVGLTERKFKVTVWYYHRAKEVYRNQTDKEATAWEREYLKQPTVIKGVRVENEPRLKVVEND